MSGAGAGPGRIVYFDCASGASGDMLLGAVVDLGLPIEELRAELAKLGVEGWRIEAARVNRSGLASTKVDVVAEVAGQPHRHLKHVLAILDASTLDAPVKERAAGLFRRLAEAEAAVHGTTPEKVHFHEVGALDSIVDIVGGVIALRWLGAARFVSSPLNVGTGTVTMSHGTFPVPPPATARLVEGAPVYGAGEGELLTPTGALLVTAHAEAYGPLPLMTVEKTGHGAGGRDTKGRPNVLRLVVGREAGGGATERVLVLETEVDDTPPQLLGSLIEKLLAAGAVDAYFTPVQMKKGRPGVLVTAIAPPAAREAIEEVLFRETTTLGVRSQEWERTALERETRTVETAFGPIRVKIGLRRGAVRNAWPEFADCEKAAAGRDVPVKEVLAAALAAWCAADTNPKR